MFVVLLQFVECLKRFRKGFMQKIMLLDLMKAVQCNTFTCKLLQTKFTLHRVGGTIGWFTSLIQAYQLKSER